MNNALHIFAGNVEFAALHGTAADEDGAVIRLQFIKGNILANPLIEVNLHTQVFDDFDFRLQNILGQAVFGNTHGQPATRNGQGFENVHIVAFNGQIISAGQARRTGADHGDFLALAFFLFGNIAGVTVQIQISDKLLEVHNIDRIIHLGSHTGRFAGMIANATADDGERIILFDELQCFLEFAFGNQCHITLNTDVRGAMGFTGRGSHFVNRKTAGNGLREMTIDGFPFTEIAVKSGGNRNGTDFGTVTATRTFIQIDVPRCGCHFNFEFSGLAFDRSHGPAGLDFNIGMAADFDQFGRQYTGRTVIRREGLVQLSHDTADADSVFDEIDFHSGIGQIERRLNAGDSRTNYHYSTNFFVIF